MVACLLIKQPMLWAKVLPTPAMSALTLTVRPVLSVWLEDSSQPVHNADVSRLSTLGSSIKNDGVDYKACRCCSLHPLCAGRGVHE